MAKRIKRKGKSGKLSYNIKEVWGSNRSNAKKNAYSSAKKLRKTIVDKYGKKYKVYAKVDTIKRTGKLVSEGIISKKAYRVLYAYKAI